MAITATISRARENNFLELYSDELKLKDAIESANPGDHITLHAGDYYAIKNTFTSLEIPANVYLTILPGADIPLDDTIDPITAPDSDTEFPKYDIFTGATENIADLNLLDYQNFYDRAVWAVQHKPDLYLKDLFAEELHVPHDENNPIFTVNLDENGVVKIDQLGQHELLVSTTSDGEIDSYGSLTYDGSVLSVNADQTISGTLDVDSQTTLASVNVEDLTNGRVVFVGASGELTDSPNFTFDSNNLILTVSGDQLITGDLEVNGQSTLASANVEDLTEDRVVFAGTNGELEDSADLTFDGSTFTLAVDQQIGGDLDVDGQTTMASANVEDLTDQRIVYAGPSGELIDSSNLTFDGSLLSVTGDLDVTQDISALNVSTTEDIDVGDELSVGSNATVGNDLNVGGDGFIGYDLTVGGDITANGNFNVSGTMVTTGQVTAPSMNVTDLANDRIVVTQQESGRNGELTTYNNLGYDGSTYSIGTVANPVTVDIEGDLIVAEDFTVNGTTTIINTEEVFVNDNVLKMNAGVTGAPTLNASFQVERGTSDDVEIRWNETSDVWEFTNDGSNYETFASISSASYTSGDGIIVDNGTSTISHDDTSSVTDTSNSGVTFIQNLTFDQFGHVQSVIANTVTITQSATIDQTIAGGGGTYTVDLETVFSSGTLTDDSTIQVFVLDSVSGSPTNGEYIEATGVVTTVKRTNEYVIHNEHPNSQDFKIVVHTF